MKQKNFLLLIFIMAIVFSACTGGSNINSNESVFSDNKQQELPLNNRSYDETFSIQTAYGNLEYPKRWEERIEVTESGNRLQFYANVQDKERQHVFDIVFGENDVQAGDFVGTIQYNDETVKVYVITFDVNESLGWAESEIADFYTMQEDLNEILASLQENAGFTYALTH